MIGLDEFEREVLDKLLAGDHPALAILRQQSAQARLVERELTGVGFYCEFEVAPNAPALSRDFQIGDVQANVEGLARGAGFVLFVREGRISLSGLLLENRVEDLQDEALSGFG